MNIETACFTETSVFTYLTKRWQFSKTRDVKYCDRTLLWTATGYMQCKLSFTIQGEYVEVETCRRIKLIDLTSSLYRDL